RGDMHMPAKQWVLVTGAASGIGRVATLLLAERGFGVYATDMSKGELDDLPRMAQIIPLRMDITNDADVGKTFEFIDEQGMGLFALINNAGIFSPGPLMDLSIERLMQQYSVNVFGTHRVTKSFFPLLLKAKGRIVNVSSVAGF